MTLSYSEIRDQYTQMQNGVQRKMYHGATVIFKEELILDEAETAKNNGIPKYKEIDTVSIRYPGGDETVLRVEERHKQEYPEQWKAYQDGKEQPIDGLPLSQWPVIPRAVVEELKYYSIRTVEQLRDLNDEAKRKIGPLVSWHKKAVEWDKAANSKQAEVVALREQVQRQTERADRLEEKLELALQRIDSVEGNNLSELNRGGRKRSE